MAVHKITLPDSLHLKDFDIEMIIASKLFEEGKLSSGQASKIVGISKRAFIELVGKHGVSIFSSDFDELQSDIKSA